MAVTAWLDPSANSSTGWSNLGNVYTQDGASSSATAAGGAETGYVRIHNFVGLAAAVTGATSIDGFEVRMYGNFTGTRDYDYAFLGDVLVGAPQTSGSKGWGLLTGTAAYRTFGGAADLWGTKVGGGVWAPADFTTAFGLSGAWAGNGTVNIDHVQLRVYYTAPGGGATGKWWWGN